MKKDQEITDLSFEEALGKLQEIVKEIESGQDSLEKVIEQYELGNRLKAHCESKLIDAKLRIEKITKENGENKTEKIHLSD